MCPSTLSTTPAADHWPCIPSGMHPHVPGAGSRDRGEHGAQQLGSLLAHALHLASHAVPHLHRQGQLCCQLGGMGSKNQRPYPVIFGLRASSCQPVVIAAALAAAAHRSRRRARIWISRGGERLSTTPEEENRPAWSSMEHPGRGRVSTTPAAGLRNRHLGRGLGRRGNEKRRTGPVNRCSNHKGS